MVTVNDLSNLIRDYEHMKQRTLNRVVNMLSGLVDPSLLEEFKQLVQSHEIKKHKKMQSIISKIEEELLCNQKS